jgi:hypothetical protein
MAQVDAETAYRAGWARIVRQLSLATALRYAVPAALLASATGLLARKPMHYLVAVLALAALVTQILIRCPRF